MNSDSRQPTDDKEMFRRLQAEAAEAGLPFRYFTPDQDRASYVWNPFPDPYVFARIKLGREGGGA